MDWQTYTHSERQTDWRKDRVTHIPKDRQTDRPLDRRTEINADLTHEQMMKNNQLAGTLLLHLPATNILKILEDLNFFLIKH